MVAKYKPKHMKEVDRMKLPNITYRPFVAAGLTGVMVAQAVLGPISAVAAEVNGAETADVAVEEVAVSTSFSKETQRLIQAAEQKVKISLEEANALLAAVEDTRDEAYEADRQQGDAVLEAQQVVADTNDELAAARDDADAELQAQVDALNQQLADAQKAVEDTVAAQKDAEEELAELEDALPGAESDAADAAEALDEANAALEEAQAALDALGENPTADEQAAYDEAKAAYDAAVADRDEKQAAYDEAAGKLEDLNGQLGAKKSELEGANAALAEKQQAADAAAAALQAARDGYAAEVEAVKGDILAGEEQALASAQAAYDAAKAAYDEACATAEDPSTVDRSALDAAEAALAEAQAAYDSALETAGAQAEAAAQGKIDAAQAVYDQAVADRDAAQKVIDEVPGQIEALEQQIADENAKVTEADNAVTAATDEVTRTEAAKKDAEKAVQDLAGAQAAWDEKAKPLQDAVDKAEAAVEAAQGELDAANQKVSDLENQIADVQKQIDDLKAQAGETQMQAVDDFCDFLVWLEKKTYIADTNSSDCSAALGYLASAWGITPSGDLEDYTNLHDPDDATAIDNILASLDMIDQLNAIRKAEGLNELEVSLFAMCEAAMHANWSAETGTIGHAVQNGYTQQWGGTWGENAAWGYTATDGRRDFFTDWYYQEKANYTKQDVTDPSTGITYHPEEGGQTGHYTNIISSGKKYTGMAYRPTSNTGYGSTAVNVFGSRDAAMGYSYRDKTYTTDALRQLIAQAQGEGVVLYHFEGGDIVYDSVEPGEGGSANQDAIDKLEAQLADLKSQLATAEQTAADKQQVYDGAVADKNAADEALAAIGERPTDSSLEDDLQKAEQAYEKALREQKAAEDKRDEIKAEVEKTVQGLTGKVTGLEADLAEAKADIDGLKQAVADAFGDLEEVKAENQDIIDAGDAYRTAQENAKAADEALAAANQTVDELNDAIDALAGDIAEQQEVVDAAKAALDAAGPTAAQTETLKKAEAALKAAQDELDRLTGARDDAQEVADAAAEAKAAADALVAEMKQTIADDKQIIADAEERLPGLVAKADAWNAVFEQQDAESIVTDGFAGATDDADIAEALDVAHLSYAEKVQLVTALEQKLAEAEAVLATAKADKETTAAELAAAEADYAMAKDAYDRLCALMGWDEQPVQQAAGKVPYEPKHMKASDEETLAQTGDPSAALAAGMALAGVAAVAGGAHFRRRRDAE